MDFKLNINTPQEVESQIAVKLKKLRLKNNFTRETLSKNSGVSFSSVKRFETTGKISFTNLLKIASALGSLNDFSSIFEDNNVVSIADLEKSQLVKNRKRGRV